MSQSNELLIISNNTKDTLGFLFIAITGIVVFYLILSIELQKTRVSKLKNIAAMIERGHNKKIQEERRKNAENKAENPNKSNIVNSDYGNQYITKRMR